jgi:hypothetical protein
MIAASICCNRALNDAAMWARAAAPAARESPAAISL